MREIKFRAFMVEDNHMETGQGLVKSLIGEHGDGIHYHVMQYTGLKDKNGDKEVYECDIIDSEGNIIGNQYETPALHEDKANLLIQGFGTKNWFTTYKEAVDRGCHDA